MCSFMKQHKDKQHSILQVNPVLRLAYEMIRVLHASWIWSACMRVWYAHMEIRMNIHVVLVLSGADCLGSGLPLPSSPPLEQFALKWRILSAVLEWGGCLCLFLHSQQSWAPLSLPLNLHFQYVCSTSGYHCYLDAWTDRGTKEFWKA